MIKAAATPPKPASNGCGKVTNGSIPISEVTSPARLLVDQAQVSPSTVTFGTSTVTARFHVVACSAAVQGALVYVTAVPYNQFSIPNEQPTGTDGWATLQMNRQVGFPATQASSCSSCRPRTQTRRTPARRHLNPTPRLIPRHQVTRQSRVAPGPAVPRPAETDLALRPGLRRFRLQSSRWIWLPPVAPKGEPASRPGSSSRGKPEGEACEAERGSWRSPSLA